MMSSSPLLTDLCATVTRVRAAGRAPLVVLDLDGTLYDSRVRTLRLLLELAHELASEHPELLAAVQRLTTTTVAYRVSDTLARVGLTEPELVGRAQAHWGRRFFTNESVLHDLPTPGAVAFVRSLHTAGAVPCYLTGRDAPNMLLGTVQALQRDGFPVGTLDTRLILKASPALDDLEYKAAVIASLADAGTVVGAFDNEPGLCNLFRAACPEARVIHLATTHSPGAPPLDAGLRSIADFRELLG